MIVNRELRSYSSERRVWVGKYENLINLPHWHSDCEIVYCETGEAKCNVNGRDFILAKGQCAFIAPRSTHFIQGANGSILAFILFDSELTKSVIGEKELVSPLLSKDYSFLQIFQALDEELSGDLPLFTISVNNRIERLILDIFMGEKTQKKERDEGYLDEQYKALIKEIDLQYANYSLSHAARFMALSESYFSRFFKRRTDMTFTQYLNLVRVEKAIDLLRTTKLNMTEVAIACGFGTIRNFNRMFKRITGYSPSTLPATYSQLQIHPTYEVENAVDPTDARSILLKPSEY